MSKIRNGFVSNSSSSSFVIIGVEINDEDYKKYQDNGYEFENVYNIDGLEYLSDDGNGYYGKIISYSEDSDNLNFSIDKNDIDEVINKIPEKYKSKVKVISGTIYN